MRSAKFLALRVGSSQLDRINCDFTNKPWAGLFAAEGKCTGPHGTQIAHSCLDTADHNNETANSVESRKFFAS